MSTKITRAVTAFTFLALAAAPALACEDHDEAHMPNAQSAAAIYAPITSALAAPQADVPTRSTQNEKAAPNTGLMFEKPFQKWWGTED